MWWFALPVFAQVTLHVGVHVDAGTVRDVAVDGADGQCALGPSWLSCPASEPVTFRWGPGGPWELAGDTVLAPGETGIAWVLAPEADRVEARARLDPESVTHTDVRELFVRYGRNQPEPPSFGMIEDLLALSDHPDKLVRRNVVEAMHPWAWRSSLGPLPPDAPIPIPSGTLLEWSTDRDKGVRRRTALLIRDMRPSPLADEAAAVLVELATDSRRGVRRATHATLARAPVSGAMPVEEAWLRALEAVPQDKGPGRAAANTLAKLAQETGPTDVIDPEAAVATVLQHHPERVWRVWGAWRDEVPFHRSWVDVLLRDTLGLHPGLLKHWAATDPEPFADAIRAWEPIGPHSERFDLVRRYLAGAEHLEVRAALGLE